MAMRYISIPQSVLTDSELDYSRSGVDTEYTQSVLDHPPVHPVPAMQEAFEESIQEAADGDLDTPDDLGVSAEDRRRDLLDKEHYDASWSARWKQKPTARCHPIMKLMSQIVFGLHLLQQGQAKSEVEVVKILQVHVDEIDAFLEKTTEDFDLAVKDIEDRITFLKLPMQHVEVFDAMLNDKKFRMQLIDGNVKIESIIERTANAMNAGLHDVQRGINATQQLADYLNSVALDWPRHTSDQSAIYVAMKGNDEGWRACLRELQDKGHQLGVLLVKLGTVVGEMSELAAVASRRNRIDSLSLPPSPDIPQSPPQPIGHKRVISQDLMNKPLPKVPDAAGAAVLATIPIQHDIVHKSRPAPAKETGLANRARRMGSKLRGNDSSGTGPVASQTRDLASFLRDWSNPRKSRMLSRSQGLRSLPSQSFRITSKKQIPVPESEAPKAYSFEAQRKERRQQQEAASLRAVSPALFETQPPIEIEPLPIRLSYEREVDRARVEAKGTVTPDTPQPSHEIEQLLPHLPIAAAAVPPPAQIPAANGAALPSALEQIPVESSQTSHADPTSETTDVRHNPASTGDKQRLIAVGPATVHDDSVQDYDLPGADGSVEGSTTEPVPQMDIAVKPARALTTPPPTEDAPIPPVDRHTDNAHVSYSDHIPNIGPVEVSPQQHDEDSLATGILYADQDEPPSEDPDAEPAATEPKLETEIKSFIPPLPFEHDALAAPADSPQDQTLSEQFEDSVRHTFLDDSPVVPFPTISAQPQDAEDEEQPSTVAAKQAHPEQEPQLEEVPDKPTTKLDSPGAGPSSDCIKDFEDADAAADETVASPVAEDAVGNGEVLRPDSAYAPEAITVNHDNPKGGKRHIPFDPNVVIVGPNALTAVAHRPDREELQARQQVYSGVPHVPEIDSEPNTTPDVARQSFVEEMPTTIQTDQLPKASHETLPIPVEEDAITIPLPESQRASDDDASDEGEAALVAFDHGLPPASIHQPYKPNAFVTSMPYSHDASETLRREALVSAIEPDLRPTFTNHGPTSPSPRPDNHNPLDDFSGFGIGPPIKPSDSPRADSLYAFTPMTGPIAEPLGEVRIPPRAPSRLGLFPDVNGLTPLDTSRTAPYTTFQPRPRSPSVIMKVAKPGRGNKIARLFTRKNKNQYAYVSVSPQ